MDTPEHHAETEQLAVVRQALRESSRIMRMMADLHEELKSTRAQLREAQAANVQMGQQFSQRLRELENERKPKVPDHEVAADVVQLPQTANNGDEVTEPAAAD